MNPHHALVPRHGGLPAALYEQIHRAVETIVNSAVAQSSAAVATRPDARAQRLQRERFAALSRLSVREREVLERIAAGATNKAIARDLGLGPHTVKRHVANLLDKLGAVSRAQAVACLAAERTGP